MRRHSRRDGDSRPTSWTRTATPSRFTRRASPPRPPIGPRQARRREAMDVFSAIADPSRRGMLDMLAKGERPAGDLVRAFPRLTQPAVSRHLRVLREAGLVEARARAQQRI